MSAPRRDQKGRDAKATATKTVGYGYVGRWMDGTIGWMLPEHMGGNSCINEGPSRLAKERSTKDDRFELCRITIEVIRDKRGRKITRRGGSNGSER